MIHSLANFFSNPITVSVFKIVYQTSFVWFPVILFILIKDLWLDFRRAQYLAKQNHILLEIKIPKEVFKSPKAMEYFMNCLWQPFGDGNWYLKWWKGAIRPWFSLEIVSVDGGVHFIVWTRKGFKNTIEANLYSQFPGIEIYEVPDYTLPVRFDPATTGMLACEFGLNKPDVFPIKTYVDYGMENEQEEEYKVDPLTPLIEFYGSLGRGQQAWLQIILRAHVAEEKDPETGKIDFNDFGWKKLKMIDKRWAKAAEEKIKEIYDKTKPEKKEGEDDKGNKMPRVLTKGESETIAALERSISKQGFDVGMRVIYVAPKDVWSPDNISGIIGSVTHFNSNNLNGFKPKIAGGDFAVPRYEFFPWKLWKDKRVNEEKQEMFDAYKKRAWFYRPHEKKYFVLNTEELATIFHFPGGVSTTPTFERIGSRKSDAPANLPI